MVDRTDTGPGLIDAETLSGASGGAQDTSAESPDTFIPALFGVDNPAVTQPMPPSRTISPQSQQVIDDAAATSRLNAITDNLPKMRDGLTGGFGVEEPGARTDQTIRQMESELGQAGSPLSAITQLSPLEIIKGLLMPPAGDPLGADQAGQSPAQSLVRGVVGPVLGKAMQTRAPLELEAKKREAQAIERLKKDPSIGVTKRGDWTSLSGIADKAEGTARAMLDAGAQGFTDIPANVVDSIGIGANIAGWAYSGGAEPIDQDNSIRAVARWAKEVARTYFPGDITRQEDFAVALAQGIGSTAGFWGVNSAALAARVASRSSAYLTAAIGALANAPGGYEEALQSRREGRDVSNLTLALAFMGSGLLGTLEAAPIAGNLPLPPGSKSQVIAYLETIAREGGEEGLQEFTQQVGQNLIALMHDPERRIMDQVSLNTMVGMFSGGAVKGVGLLISPNARIESVAQSRLGVEQGTKFMGWREAKLRGARPDAGPAPSSAPTTPPAAPSEPPQSPAAATAPPASGPAAKEINLDQYAEPVPVPNPVIQAPFDQAAEFSPMARMKGEAAAGGASLDVPAIPTFDFLLDNPNFPRDDNGDPDLNAFYDLLEGVTGKRNFNSLTSEEKIGVEQALATGVIPDVGQGGAAPVQSATPAAGAASPSGSAAPPSAPPMNDAETRYINRMRAGDSTKTDDELRQQYRSKWAARSAPEPAQPQREISPEEQVANRFRQAGANSQWLERAMQIPPVIDNKGIGDGALDSEISLPISAVQDDGSVVEDSAQMPAIDALTMIDRRLKGIALLLGCVG